MSDRLSPLDASHRARSARMVPFGGWSMPLSYPEGTLAEHRLCRTDAVVFDVSHLGTIRVSGPDAFDLLQRTLTNDLDRIAPGEAQYTHLLDPVDGSVVDDIIVWWLPTGGFDVMPNASNTDGVTGALGAAGVGDTHVVDVTAQRAVLAVQGPQSRARLVAVSPQGAAVPRFGVVKADVAGVACVVAGTGYTGEDGVEIAVPAEHAPQVFDALVDAGISPAGLGARDTLRLEAGLPLWGNDLGPGITPLQAGLGFVVAWDKGDFVGRGALEHERLEGPHRQLVALTTADRRPPRSGDEVLVDDEVVGNVTSGNFSPMLGVGIALALVAGGATPGDTVLLRGRGNERPATVVNLPFVNRS